MILLSGFTTSAMLVILALYVVLTTPVFFILLLIAKQIPFTANILDNSKNRSRGMYTVTLLVVFAISAIVLYGLTLAINAARGKALLE